MKKKKKKKKKNRKKTKEILRRENDAANMQTQLCGFSASARI